MHPLVLMPDSRSTSYTSHCCNEPEIAHPSILASQSDLILHVEAFLSFDWLTVKGHLASGYGGIKAPSSYPRLIV